MKWEHLLAKTTDDPKNPKHEETLLGHTDAVIRSTQTILKFFQQSDIPKSVDFNWERFERLTRFGAVFHDLGKATNVFQGILLKEPDFFKKYQPVRHEILSALIIAKIDSPIKKLVNSLLSEQDVWLLSWIVGGHHLKLCNKTAKDTKETDKLVRVCNIPKDFIFWGSHPDIKKLFSLLMDLTLQKYSIPDCKDIPIPIEESDDLDSENLESIVLDYLMECENRKVNILQDDKELISFAKATLISADVAGSALTKEGEIPSVWIEKQLNVILSENALEKIIQDNLKGDTLRLFQINVASSTKNVTITIAGCGNGKTIAAYEWAKNHAKGKKLYFCYPTTGTASAGFEDYLLAQSDMERALIHSRSQVDMERMLSSDDDYLEENQRLSSLQTWGQQVVACTVDTVLGLIQNHRKALFSFPALLKSAFVFDEIHSYDEKLFGALLCFLKVFSSIPVLLMSATIPETRLKALKEILGDRMGEPIKGEATLENMERYILTWVEDQKDCWDNVKNTLKNTKNNKVLWVCNTVNDAIQVYEDSELYDLGVKPLLYHSRFRYKDRVDRQKEVINAFKKTDAPAFIIATQVCEMSLNISADLMISALAPFSAMIQRLGRLNRNAHKDECPALCRCLIYDFNGKPYDNNELKNSKKALENLFNKPCNQEMLANALLEIYTKEDFGKFSAWIDGVWESDQRPLRSGGSSVITVILEKDVDEIKKELSRKKQKPNFQTLASWSLPMLYKPEILFSKRYGGLPVVSDVFIKYDLEKGARWSNEKWIMY